MSQVKTGFNPSVIFLKEGDRFVAYSPALDLSTCGETLEEARHRLAEAAALFIQELHRKGVTKKFFPIWGGKRKIRHSPRRSSSGKKTARFRYASDFSCRILRRFIARRFSGSVLGDIG